MGGQVRYLLDKRQIKWNHSWVEILVLPKNGVALWRSRPPGTNGLE